MTAPYRALCVALLVGLSGLTACREEVVAPAPAELTRAAIGHYCNMIIADHPGPKIQVHEKGKANPIWFSSVRDGLAYLSLPGEAKMVVAAYVHDMGRAQSWEKPPHAGIWIKASEAVYVVGSERRGGMGAKEAVPFGERTKAESFAETHGGAVVSYEDIPTDYVLGDEGEHAPNAGHKEGHAIHGG